MKNDLSRWPHARYTEKLRPGPDSARSRLLALHEKATQLQRVVEIALGKTEKRPGCPKLLIVEDDVSASNALNLLFARRGWEVTVARTLAEGLACLNDSPDCLLLDLMLPDGDGEVILKVARSLGLSPRVVIATGIDDPNRLEALDRLGVDSLLVKPVTLDEICRACRGMRP